MPKAPPTTELAANQAFSSATMCIQIFTLDGLLNQLGQVRMISQRLTLTHMLVIEIGVRRLYGVRQNTSSDHIGHLTTRVTRLGLH